MRLLNKIIPKTLKNKIKKSMGISDKISIEKIADDVAERKLAQILALQNYKRFQNKLVFVIGGSGCIGQAICWRFAREGATVLVGGRSLKKLTIVVEALKTDGFKAEAIEIDVSDYNSIKNAFLSIEKRVETLDICINCAGGSARDDWAYLIDQSCEVIDSVLTLNLRGTILCSQETAKIMSKQKSGKIINIASTVGIGGKAGFSEYAAVKAGIIGFTKSLALEMGEYHVTVNCVTPGIVQRGECDLTKINYISKTNCMNSMSVPDDIAYACTFLASDEANFITGQNYVIDGGRSIGLKGD